MPSSETLSGSMTETAPSPRAPAPSSLSSSSPPPMGVLPLAARNSHPHMGVGGNLPSASSSSSSAAAALVAAPSSHATTGGGGSIGGSGRGGGDAFPLPTSLRGHPASLPQSSLRQHQQQQQQQQPHLFGASFPLSSLTSPAAANSSLGIDAAQSAAAGGTSAAGITASQPPACGARQLSKLKRFLTTLMQVGLSYVQHFPCKKTNGKGSCEP